MFSTLVFIKQLISIKERQRSKEQQAARLIVRVLNARQIPFFLQSFQAKTPVIQRSELIVDGKKIPTLSTSFVGGCIHGKHAVLSSLISSQRTLYDANINFNPECEGISRSNHYFAPSVAVAKQHVDLILKAKSVEGFVKVKKVSHTSANILIGNRVNPKHILFCHYDSFGPGATDNASGTAVLLKLAIDYPHLQKNCLFVLSGNEELSYDKPIYWGHGYRVFEQRCLPQIQKAKSLIMADCVGNGKTTVDHTLQMIRLGLPLKQIDTWKKKVHILYGDVEKLMQVYHSDLDTLETVSEPDLDDAVQTCLRLLK